MTATISIRWLGERGSAPMAKGPSGTAQAQPPGPGFPRQDPSVNTVVSNTVVSDPAVSNTGGSDITPACTARPVRWVDARSGRWEGLAGLKGYLNVNAR